MIPIRLMSGLRCPPRIRQTVLRSFSSCSQCLNGNLSILDALEQRGLVHQIAGDRTQLRQILQHKKIGVYSGIDPTASSLHLGHLLPLMVLFWLYHYGHHTISLVGGATSRVGDPTGRLVTREEQSQSIHGDNVQSMSAQLSQLWENVLAYGKARGAYGEEAGTRQLLNNSTWLEKVNIIEFLRALGSGMRVGTMLGKDTVRNKMTNGDGVSFAEFTYPLLQGWDWWELYRTHGVVLQVGGGDQYGNIMAGIDAVQIIAERKAGEVGLPAYNGKIIAPLGLTVPLLTTAGGAKFGKSAGNAIWLDQRLTSAFDLYGFLLGTADADIERYLKLFTFLPLTKISSTIAAHEQSPERRTAQHLLSSEIVELVHGASVSRDTRFAHESLRSPSISGFLQIQASQQKNESGIIQFVDLPRSATVNVEFSQVLHSAGITPSKAEAARKISQGGVSVAVLAKEQPDGTSDCLEFRPVKPRERSLQAALLKDSLLVLRTGKWKVRIVRVV